MANRAEIWSVTTQHRDKLAVNQRSINRAVLGVTRRAKIRNENIRTKLKDVIQNAVEVKGQ